MEPNTEPLFTPEQLAREIAVPGRGLNGRSPWAVPPDAGAGYIVEWAGILACVRGDQVEWACVGEVGEYEDCHPGQPVTDDWAHGIVEQWPAGFHDAVIRQTADDGDRA